MGANYTIWSFKVQLTPFLWFSDFDFLKAFSLKKWFKKQKKICISVNEPQNEKIKVLYFLQLLKFDKTKCLHFFISSSNSRDIAILLFSAKQGLKNHWKKTKCPYLGYNGLKWKNKGTLFSPTFKVEGNKVPLFFHFRS